MVMLMGEKMVAMMAEELAVWKAAS